VEDEVSTMMAREGCMRGEIGMDRKMHGWMDGWMERMLLQLERSQDASAIRKKPRCFCN
jgi:hypothetical protein